MKPLMLILSLLPFAALAESVDMLDYQINELTRRRDELRAELDACKANTKKFKIAGISTLGATGLGALGNIALHNKIQNMGSGGGRGGGGRGSGDYGAVPCSEYAEGTKEHDVCIVELSCAQAKSLMEWGEVVSANATSPEDYFCYGNNYFGEQFEKGCPTNEEDRLAKCCCAHFGCPCL